MDVSSNLNYEPEPWQKVREEQRDEVIVYDRAFSNVNMARYELQFEHFSLSTKS